MKKSFALLLCILIAVSFTATDAFAYNYVGISKSRALTKQVKKSKDSKKKNDSKKAKAAKPKAPTLPKPKKLRAYSGYNSVLLKWQAVPKAEEYIIYRSIAGKKKFKQVGKTKKLEHTDKIKYIYNSYAYRVVATKKNPKDKKKLIKSPPAKIRESSVKRLRIYVTFKTTKKYNSGTIKAGTRIKTDGFSGGHYLFSHKGKRHAVSRISVYNAYAKYQKKKDYSKSEAELFMSSFMKAHKVNPKTKYLIWVSSYTQHLYVFKKNKGKWVVAKDWDISMGTAATPSPTGLKSIKKKKFYHHGIRYWNCFSSWNALHGVSGNMSASLGRLASHGCIRNDNGHAAWLYAKCKKGTPVIIY